MLFLYKNKRKPRILGVILNMIEAITNVFTGKLEAYCFLKYNKIYGRYFCFHKKTKRGDLIDQWAIDF